MNKKLLIKFVSGNASDDECHKVMDWADRDARNRKYLISLKLEYLAQSVPDEKASEKQMQKYRSTINHDIEKKRERKIKRMQFVTWVSAGVAAAAVLLFIFKPSVYSEKSISKIREQLTMEVKKDVIQVALQEVPEELKHTIYTVKGVKSTVLLPDSTEVLLNSDTRIIFPDKFLGSTREVFVSGEAFFKVKKDTLHPMIVNTNKDFTIRVTGTEFNIKCYEDDDIAEATLYEGSIDVYTGKMQTLLKPNYQALIDVKQVIKVEKPVEIANPKAWTEGSIIFDETPVSEVVKILERWHGAEITVTDKSILNYKITATFSSESMPQILYVLKNCALIDYTISDNQKVTLFSR